MQSSQPIAAQNIRAIGVSVDGPLLKGVKVVGTKDYIAITVGYLYNILE